MAATITCLINQPKSRSHLSVAVDLGLAEGNRDAALCDVVCRGDVRQRVLEECTEVRSIELLKPLSRVRFRHDARKAEWGESPDGPYLRLAQKHEYPVVCERSGRAEQRVLIAPYAAHRRHSLGWEHSRLVRARCSTNGVDGGYGIGGILEISRPFGQWQHQGDALLSL